MMQPLLDGWKVRPIKHLVTYNDEVLPENTNPERQMSYVDIGNVQHGIGITGFEETAFASAPSRARRLVRDGDVIASTVRTYLRAIARIESPKDDLVVSTGFAVLRPGALLQPRFFGYAMECETLIDEIVAHSTGVSYPAIAASDLVRLKIAFPDVNTQATISDFLDRETAEADALVAKYERLVELLEEKGVALVTRAVTKGLDSDVPIKDSGIPYIGQIPSHWNVPAVWMMFSLGRGRVLSHDDIRNNPGDYPVYSSQTENNGEMGRIGTFDFDGAYLTWTTDGANAGTVFVRDGRFNCTNVCGTLKPLSPSTNLKYIQNLLNASTKYYVRLDINPKLMNDVMARIRLPQPPMREQMAIQSFLDLHLGPIEQIKERLLSSIILVRERRAALITAAVTGQIDVNNYRSTEKPAKVVAS